MNRISKLILGLVGLTVIATGIKVLLLHNTPMSHGNNVSNGVAATHPASTLQVTNVSAELNTIPAKTYYRNRVVIVTFHDIAPVAYSPYVVTPAQFSADLVRFNRDFTLLRTSSLLDF